MFNEFETVVWYRFETKKMNKLNCLSKAVKFFRKMNLSIVQSKKKSIFFGFEVFFVLNGSRRGEKIDDLVCSRYSKVDEQTKSLKTCSMFIKLRNWATILIVFSLNENFESKKKKKKQNAKTNEKLKIDVFEKR